MQMKLPLFTVYEVADIDLAVDPQTVAPILSIGSASLVAISTLTSEINFYTRLVRRMGRPVCPHVHDLTGCSADQDGRPGHRQTVVSDTVHRARV
jgi:hypothetical protein